MSVPTPTLRPDLSTPRARRKRWGAAGLGVGLVVGLGLAGTGPAPADAVAPTGASGTPDRYVTQWDAVGAAAFTESRLSPAEGHLVFAYASIAVYDSVVAVDHRFEPFAVPTRAPAATSVDAAVVAAAHRVYVHYLPAQAATVLDPAYDASLATIPDGPAKTEGVSLGERVAGDLLAARADDGFRQPATYTPPDPLVPGAWLPTATTPPVGTYVGLMRPFVLDTADQLRPDGPPALDSLRWDRDYRESQRLGSVTSAARSPEQTEAAQFWAAPPVQQAHAAFRGFVTQHGLDPVQAARLLAMLSVTYADAFIACFDAKYHFAFWRPVTAIRAGDSDGNPRTVGDPTWAALLGTPNHPEYPSAHSCVTPAAGIVLSRFLDSKEIDFTVPSLGALADRHYDTAGELTHDVGNARVWGGIHFRSAVRDGTTIARRTAHLVLADSFRPVRD